MWTDGYSLGIPLAEIRAAAVKVAPVCNCHDRRDRQQCAMALVRARICPCLLDEPFVIDALAMEVCAVVDAQSPAPPHANWVPRRHAGRLADGGLHGV